MNELKQLVNELHLYLGQSNSNILDLTTNDTRKLRQNLNDQLTILNEELPEPLNKKIDKLLQEELSKREVILVHLLSKKHRNIIIWKGDITLLKVDAIVNPANSQGLGCFQIGHRCLDNVIHSLAGPRLRNRCRRQLKGSIIPTAGTIVTSAYNLPAKYIIHTVGPIANKEQLEFNMLALTYINCLLTAKKYGFKTIAFPCISTGVFGYPKKESAEVALKTVLSNNDDILCILCTYLQEDYDAYNYYFKLMH